MVGVSGVLTFELKAGAAGGLLIALVAECVYLMSLKTF